jgi:shikimate dehydrogenase
MSEDIRSNKHVYGLIGYPLSHSFSPGYFAEKFLREGIHDSVYHAFELEQIELFPALLQNQPQLRGLNVTIPYKQSVMPYLQGLSEEAKAIAAVNTIHFGVEGLTGHNTDWIGFLQSFQTLHKQWKETKAGRNAVSGALVLGTGGSSKAVHFALNKIGYVTKSVSRNSSGNADFTYNELSASVLEEFPVLVNCTPLGMHPDVLSRPEIPYEKLGPGNLLFDLVYNPEKTIFLIKGEQQGAFAGNGLSMLYSQAEAAWAIWNPENGD